MEQFANAARTTLNGAIDASQTTLVVTSAALFPTTGTFRLIIGSELLIVTGVSANTFTVTRGAEGSVAALHATGVAVTCILTAGAIAQLRSDVAGTDGVVVLDNASTATINDVVSTVAGEPAKVIRFTGTAVVTGIAGGVDGRRLIVMAVGGQLQLKDQDTGSIAANRINTGIAALLAIPQGSGALICYDGTSATWRVIGKAKMKLTGDVTGDTAVSVVSKVNGTTITTAGGALPVGAVLRTTAVGTADWGTLDLADSDARTGTLPVGNGGTGLASPGTSGNVLTSDGSAWTSAAPAGGGSASVGGSGAVQGSDGAGAFVDTGVVGASGYLRLGAATPFATAGTALRLANLSTAYCRGVSDDKNLCVFQTDANNFLSIGGDNVQTGTSQFGQTSLNASVYVSAIIASSTIWQASASLLRSYQPIAIGTTTAAAGDLRFQSGATGAFIVSGVDRPFFELTSGAEIIFGDSTYGGGIYIRASSSGTIRNQINGTNQVVTSSSLHGIDVPVGGFSVAHRFAVGVINSTSITTFTASAGQYSCPIIQHTSSAGSGTAVWNFPNSLGSQFTVDNQDIATLVTIKVSGQLGVTIGAGKRAIIYCNGTDYVRVTPDT